MKTALIAAAMLATFAGSAGAETIATFAGSIDDSDRVIQIEITNEPASAKDCWQPLKVARKAKVFVSTLKMIPNAVPFGNGCWVPMNNDVYIVGKAFVDGKDFELNYQKADFHLLKPAFKSWHLK